MIISFFVQHSYNNSLLPILYNILGRKTNHIFIQVYIQPTVVEVFYICNNYSKKNANSYTIELLSDGIIVDSSDHSWCLAKTEYHDMIFTYDIIRKKRKLTPEAIKALKSLMTEMDEYNSLRDVYEYIQVEREVDPLLKELSYSSIWRAYDTFRK